MLKIFKQILVLLVVLCGGGFIGTGAIAQNEAPQQTGWSTTCLSPRLCEMKNEIRTSSGEFAARVSILNLRGLFVFQYTIPLGIDLTQDVFIRVDDGPNILAEVSNCSDIGCTGSLRLTAPVIQSMKQGSNIVIFFSSSISQAALAITFDLNGFTTNFGEITGG